MKMLMHAFRSLIERRLHDVLGTAGSCFLCVEGIVPVHPATFELKAGFHPMEGENNMEWHGPNGPTYDNMMYDGNNQRNGYMHHGNDERMSETSWQANHHRGKRPDKRPDKRLSQFFRYNSRSKVFVGGLCSRTTDESLRAAFEHCGNVINASVLVDSQTRRSRGFGYVTFLGEVPEGVSGRDIEVDGRMCGVRLYE